MFLLFRPSAWERNRKIWKAVEGHRCSLQSSFGIACLRLDPRSPLHRRCPNQWPPNPQGVKPPSRGRGEAPSKQHSVPPRNKVSPEGKRKTERKQNKKSNSRVQTIWNKNRLLCRRHEKAPCLSETQYLSFKIPQGFLHPEPPLTLPNCKGVLAWEVGQVGR